LFCVSEMESLLSKAFDEAFSGAFCGTSLSFRCGLPIRFLFKEDSDLTYLLEHLWPLDEYLGHTPYIVLAAINRGLADFVGSGTFINILGQASNIRLYNPRLDENIRDYDDGLLYVDGDLRLIHNPKTNGTIIRRGHSVVCFNEVATARCRDLRRAAKQILSHWIFASGGTIVHASAFSINGLGALVIGPKGSGKTTILRCALEHFGARFLGNDRTVVFSDPTSPADLLLLPWTEPVRIINENKRSQCDKRELLLSALLSGDESKVAAKAPLRLIILPSLSNESIYCINEPPLDQLTSAIQSESLSPRDSRRPSWAV
jgi:hypothetical protein